MGQYLLTTVFKLNARQLWFLGKLQQGAQLRSTAIVNEWAVSQAVAQRDVRKMVEMELITYRGAPRNGCYEMVG
jgi:1,4-dihydroxy-2-naphthoyl-CoA synthase